MNIIEIQPLSNGAHRNQNSQLSTIPDGWAVIPDNMEIPDTFPFVDITVEEIFHEVEVTEAIERAIVDEEGNTVTIVDEVVNKEVVGTMTVTSMTPGVVPEPEPTPSVEPEPTTREILNALLGVTE